MKVLAVMGSGRAGSTLLDTLLGSIEGFFSAGELRYVWNDGGDEARCGCGTTISRCTLWSEILHGASSGTNALAGVDTVRVRGWQDELCRTRHTPSLLRARAGDAHLTRLRDYLAVMDALYARIAAVTRSTVIVDSSKRPSDAALLRLLPSVDAYVVHLVRDPRAVAYSWQRQKPDPGSTNTDGRMPTRSVLLSTGVWLELNGMGQLVRRRFGADRSLFVRYEDFVRHPRRTVEQILDLLDEVADPPVDDDGTAHLHGNHTVGGNPNRFTTGPIEIRPDDAWKDNLGRAESLACSAMAAPLNALYRYPLHLSTVRRTTGTRSIEGACR